MAESLFTLSIRSRCGLGGREVKNRERRGNKKQKENKFEKRTGRNNLMQLDVDRISVGNV